MRKQFSPIPQLFILIPTHACQIRCFPVQISHDVCDRPRVKTQEAPHDIEREALLVSLFL